MQVTREKGEQTSCKNSAFSQAQKPPYTVGVTPESRRGRVQMYKLISATEDSKWHSYTCNAHVKHYWETKLKYKEIPKSIRYSADDLNNCHLRTPGKVLVTKTQQKKASSFEQLSLIYKSSNLLVDYKTHKLLQKASQQ